jgi:hypothetical protein
MCIRRRGSDSVPSMTASTSSTTILDPSRRTGVKSQAVTVEFRAAPLAEIRRIDLTADELVLPAQVLMTRREFRRAIEPFPFERPSFHGTPRPPGSLIWAQLASPAGDMIVGGRDINGLPSVPMPVESSVLFVSAAPHSVDDRSGSQLRSAATPISLLELPATEPQGCRPIIDADGVITCVSSECEGCLGVLTRNSWTTSIACWCAA